jgi:predicted ATPase
MSDIEDMLLLLVLCAIVILWLKLTSARERAMSEARAQCERYGLQLLDESVGLRAVRIRRVDGLRRIERGYSFEVSTDGDDRAQGRLWMIGSSMTELSLPTIEVTSTESIVAEALAKAKASSNVVQLHPGRRPPDEPLH